MTPICPYCCSPAQLIDSAVIYHGRSYGPAWACANYPACDSYVGCHPGTTKPLGRLADAELRQAKRAAHAAFDPIWRCQSRGSKSKRRGNAYRWLAKQLGLTEGGCHIGEFDVAMCRRVIEVCQQRKVRT